MERGENIGQKLAYLLTVPRCLFHFAKKLKPSSFRCVLLNANHSQLAPRAGHSGHRAVVHVAMEFKHALFEVPGFIYAIYYFICITSCKMNPGSAQYGEKREIRTCSKTCNFYFWTFGSWSECNLDGGNCGKGNLNWRFKT